MPSASSTKRSAVVSLRDCSTTSAPSAAWPTASAEASAPTSGIPAFCRSSMGTKSDSTIEAIQAAGEDIDNLAKAAHHRRRNPARQRRHPQRLHLPSRLARQDSRRAHDLRVLRISSRLARQVSGGNQDGYGSRRQPGRRQVPASRINSPCWSSATPRNSTSRCHRSAA